MASAPNRPKVPGGTRAGAGSGGFALPPCSHPLAATGSSARGKGSIDPLFGFLERCGQTGVYLSPKDFRRLDQPVFWPEEEQRWLLQGTGIPEAVKKDLASIHLEYSSMILLFIESYPNVFDPKLYKQLVAFVMAYRNLLEEEDEDKGPSPLMMVANHNANLEYSPVHAKLLQQAASCSGSSLP